MYDNYGTFYVCKFIVNSLAASCLNYIPFNWDNCNVHLKFQ